MTALDRERRGSIRKVRYDKRPLASNVKAFKGARAACDADGFYCPATGAATEVPVGVFAETVDNTGGADGAKWANIDFLRDRTLLLQVNDSGGSALAITDRERPCYQLDDQTVTADSTKSFTGIVYDVTSEGVWVDVSAGPRGPQGEPGGG